MAKFKVSGKVSLESGTAAKGLKIKAYDTDVKGQLLLGDAVTGDTGAYLIEYETSILARRGKQQPDLQLRVFDSAKKELLLGVSLVIKLAKAAEVVNIPISAVDDDDDDEADDKKPGIAFPLAFLNKGESVVALHRALIFLKYQILDKERSGKLYGRGTRASILKFQKEQGLDQTGAVNEATAKKLDKVLEDKSFFKPRAKPFQGRFLLTQTKELDNLDDAPTQTLVRRRLGQSLTEVIVSHFKDPSDQLRDAVKELDLDITALENKDLRDVIREDVLPQLLEIPELDEELDEMEEDAFEEPLGTVGEVLHLDKSFKRNPLFAKEVRRIKNQELATLVKLADKKREKIQDLSLEAFGDDHWEKLVEDKTLEPAEREELERAVELSNLTDDNFKAVDALRKKGVKNSVELAKMDKADWMEFFRINKVDPPDDDDLESFAENIATNVEQTHPTRFFMHRTVERKKPEPKPDLARIAPLLQKNKRVFNRSGSDELDWEGIKDTDREGIEKSLNTLQEFANIYRHLDITSALEEENVNDNDKIAKVNRRLGLLATFNEKNPNLDLRTAHLHRKNDGVPAENRVKLDGINDEADQEMVLRQMRSFQRVLHLAEDYDTAQKILKNGFDSATSIANTPEDTFIAKTGLRESRAKMIHQRARNLALTTSHAIAALEEDFTNAIWFGGRLSGVVGTPQSKSHFKDIPGYDEFFGSQNYCNCKDCRSIFSPAAYFVDLMEFIKSNVSDEVFKSKNSTNDLYLKNRRPDLWELPLTCENTNKSIPYLDIVVEVLEKHILKKKNRPAGYDVYEELSRAGSSFSLPFNLPLERLRLYLNHFEVELAEVYKLIGAKVTNGAIERLGFSPRERDSLAGSNLDAAKARFGDKFPSNGHVREFLKVTGLTRPELDALMKTKYISQVRQMEIQPFISTPLGDSTNANRIFEALGQGLEEKFTVFANEHFQLVYFFVKVWRAVPWTMEELDNTLAACMKRPDFDGSKDQMLKLLATIGNLVLLQKKTGFSVEQMIALIHEIPSEKSDSLFQRLFGAYLKPGDVKEIELQVLDEGKKYFTFSDSTASPVNAELFAHLQGALGLSAVDMQRLTGNFRTPGTGDDLPPYKITLNKDTLTRMLRYALMAKMLGLNIEQLLFLERYPVGKADGLKISGFSQSLDHIFKLMEIAGTAINQPFSLDELYLLITGKPIGDAKYRIGPEQLKSLVESLPTDPTVYFSAGKLAECNSISPEDSVAIIEKMEERGLLIRRKIYRLAERYAVADAIVMQGAEAVFQGPGGVIADESKPSAPESNSLIFNNRAHILAMFQRNRQQISPIYLTEVGKVDKNAIPKIFNALEQRKILIPVSDFYRLYSHYDFTAIDFLKPVIDAFNAIKTEPEKGRGKRLAALVKNSSETIREALKPYHTPLPGFLSSTLGISQERYDAIKVALNHPAMDWFIHNYEVLMFTLEGGPQPDTANLVKNMLWHINRFERVQLIFERFKFDDACIRFIATDKPKFFYGNAFGTNPGDDNPSNDRPIYSWPPIEYMNCFSRLLSGKDAEQKKQLIDLIKTWNPANKDHRLLLAGFMNTVPAQFFEAEMKPDFFDTVIFQEKILGLQSRLNMDGKSMEKLNVEDYPGLKNAAAIALNAIKAKYPEGEWEKILEPLENKIRARQRDALITYLLTNNSSYKFKDERDLMQYFLLDVNMEGCARISKIKAATLSLQLYVHYIRMNLERGANGLAISAGLITDKEWLWRKNYRVWEAAQKVFVYPECYLEPDLRPNKTSLFRAFEDNIYQNDPSKKKVVEEAYLRYLTGLKEVANLHIADCHFDEETATYYFIGRTKTKPYRHYWRTYNKSAGFTDWQQVGLEINAERVSPVIFNGLLYILWTDFVITAEKGNKPTENPYKSDESPRTSKLKATVKLKYVILKELNDWAKGASIVLYSKNVWIKRFDHGEFPGTEDKTGSNYTNKLTEEEKNIYTEKIEKFISQTKLIPYVKGGQLYVEFVKFCSTLAYHFMPLSSSIQRWLVKEEYRLAKINLYSGTSSSVKGDIGYNQSFNQLGLTFNRQISQSTITECTVWYNNEVEFHDGLLKKGDNSYSTDKTVVGYFSLPTGIRYIQRRPLDSIANLGGASFLVLSSGKNEDDVAYTHGGTGRKFIRLSAVNPGRFTKSLFTSGIDTFLAPAKNQDNPEPSPGIMTITKPGLRAVQVSFEPSNHIDFNGAFGSHYRELFFHQISLVANYLNSIGKYEDADYWYKKIFDPTKAKGGKSSLAWQYLEFREHDPLSLYDMLTDSKAIAVHEEDPFNPHAIARLRLSAYMKNIIMKYIDNILDWADSLYSRDTFESINEALMLYVHARDLLGEKPYVTGECKTTDENVLTYSKIEKEGDVAGIIVEMENVVIHAGRRKLAALAQELPELPQPGPGIVRPRMRARNYREGKAEFMARNEAPSADGRPRMTNRSHSVGFGRLRAKKQDSKSLAFCVPPNPCLYAYWDKVEDRLFKIRNCMNMEGVRRQLDLYGAPIDPMMLVRARAAGMSLEDILDMLTAKPPVYRFSYLLEKAKEFSRTVQGYGSTLLSALEKKDSEELTLLRSVHEQELLSFVERVKKETIEEAKAGIEVIRKTQASVEARKLYYEGLLSNVADQSFGFDGLEASSLKLLEDSKKLQRKASDLDGEASLVHADSLIPTITRTANVSTPTVIGTSNTVPVQAIASITFSDGPANQAASYSAKANKERLASTEASLSAGIISTKAGYNRRRQEWENQKKMADKELEQIEKQIIAAEVRHAIAEKDLESHRKQMDQSRELYDFYKDKFTNMGLYTYLSTQLTRLYRQAYNMALDMARQAERAYQFERDEQAYFIKNDNWDTNRAGLLAGERLLLQLQQMEKSYMEKNTRDYEINQSFSLLQLAPGQLIQLKEHGNCAFVLPEAAYDLVYPGYYKRIIKSVRLTVPCVTGPYTNVSCKLSLMGSSIRRNPTANDNDLFAAPNTLTNSIATSTANNDGGVFELNFRDERYLPFEGAGAVESRWALLMPEQFRAFDYNTISDVVIHVSYTAKFDGGLRSQVESELLNQVNAMVADNSRQDEPGLFRLFSLKHEFGDAYHELLNGAPSVTIQVDNRHFPMLFMGRQKRLAGTVVHVLPKQGRTLSPPPALTVTPPTGNITGPWSIRFNPGINALQTNDIDNIFIEVRYTL